MDFSWPNFTKKRKLHNGLYWTAIFHSFNQRHNDLYYVITLYEKSQDDFMPCNRFGVVISEPSFFEKPISKSEISEYIIKNLETQAEHGVTNIPKNILWKGLGQEDIDKL